MTQGEKTHVFSPNFYNSLGPSHLESVGLVKLGALRRAFTPPTPSATDRNQEFFGFGKNRYILKLSQSSLLGNFSGT